VVILADEDSSVSFEYEVNQGNRYPADIKPSQGFKGNIVPELLEVIGEPGQAGTLSDYMFDRYIFQGGQFRSPGGPFGGFGDNNRNPRYFPLGKPDSDSQYTGSSIGGNSNRAAPYDHNIESNIIYNRLYRNYFPLVNYYTPDATYPESGDVDYNPEFIPDTFLNGDPRDKYSEVASYLNDFMNSAPAGLLGVIIVPVGNFSNDYIESLPWPHNIQGRDFFRQEPEDPSYNDCAFLRGEFGGDPLECRLDRMAPRQDKSIGFHEQYVSNLNYFKSYLEGEADEKIIITESVDPSTDYSQVIIDEIKKLEEKYDVETDYIINFIDSSPSFDYGPDTVPENLMILNLLAPPGEQAFDTPLNVDTFWNYQYIKFAETFKNYFIEYSSQKSIDELNRLQSVNLPPLNNTPTDSGAERKGGTLLVDMSTLGYASGSGTKHIFIPFTGFNWLNVIWDTVFAIGVKNQFKDACAKLCEYRWTTNNDRYIFPLISGFPAEELEWPYTDQFGNTNFIEYGNEVSPILPYSFYYNFLQQNGDIPYNDFFVRPGQDFRSFDPAYLFPVGGEDLLIPSDIDLFEYYNIHEVNLESMPGSARAVLNLGWPRDTRVGIASDSAGGDPQNYFGTASMYPYWDEINILPRYSDRIKVTSMQSGSPGIYYPDTGVTDQGIYYDIAIDEDYDNIPEIPALSLDEIYQTYFGTTESIYQNGIYDSTIIGVGSLRSAGPLSQGRPILIEDQSLFRGLPDPFVFGMANYKCPCAFHYPINNYLEFSQKSDSSEQEGLVEERTERDEEQNGD
jgi:hypothetical protein